MARITKLTRQQRRQERFSIYLDDKYAFSVSSDTALKERLFEGKELNDAEIAGLKRVAFERDAHEKALAKLARRVHSEREIRDYLQRKDYESELIDNIIGQLTEAGLLNDATFARSWVEERRRLKNYSRRQLWGELMQKGIAKELIDEVLSGGEEEELGALQRLIERKRRLSAYSDEPKLIAYLQRKGYPYGLIRRALDETAE